jgi:hypothetical protein
VPIGNRTFLESSIDRTTVKDQSNITTNSTYLSNLELVIINMKELQLNLIEQVLDMILPSSKVDLFFSLNTIFIKKKARKGLYSMPLEPREEGSPHYN